MFVKTLNQSQSRYNRIKLNLSTYSRLAQIFKPKFLDKNIDKKAFLFDKYATFSFEKLINLSSILSNDLLLKLNKRDMNGEKVGVYCNNNYTYLISILAIWQANAVPFCLNKQYPNKFLEYFLNDSKCKLVINGYGHDDDTEKENNFVKMLGEKRIFNFQLSENEFHLSPQSMIKKRSSLVDLIKFLSLSERKNKSSLLLYTSGTSGPAKGVVISFENLLSSIDIMIHAYKWTESDCVLSALPLNHYSAQCLLLPKFDHRAVWSKLLNENSSSDEPRINFFIGVPTVFTQLVNSDLIVNKNNIVKEVLKKKMRVIASGSAPLVVKTFKDWYDLTNFSLVERYGMTEIGMALTNPYVDTADFKKEGGLVGRPVGPICCRLVREDKILIESQEKTDLIYDNDVDLFGELQIKGPNVFSKYLNKPEQTSESFTKDGWFKTGDTARFLRDKRTYKIVGRTSVDVIKSGGFKISALDIEKELLGHPLIDDVAVMGITDSMWGQRVFSLLVLKQNSETKFDEKEFTNWCRLRLPKQSVPTLIKIIDKMPRNQLGKVNKRELINKYEKIFAE